MSGDEKGRDAAWPIADLTAAEQQRLQAVTQRPAVQALLALLNDTQARTLVVGGAVRNALLGRPVADLDFATSLTPHAVQARAHAAGLKTIPTGIEHGTITLLSHGQAFEITTLRQDIATDGRRATIAYSSSFAEDAARRDFSMNALYADHNATLFDPVGGLADLRQGRLRFIGDAATRIREDYLRILRFFRFYADYAHGPMDQPGLQACITLKDGMRTLSRERIGQEWLKLLMARRAAETIAHMHTHGLLDLILPSAADPAGLDRLLALDPHADAMTRLFVLLRPSDPPFAALQTSLRLSNAQARYLGALAHALQQIPSLAQAHQSQPAWLARWAFRHGGAIARTALTVWAALHEREAADWMALRPRLESLPERSPFSGADLLAQGLRAGPDLGQALENLNDLWIDAGCPTDPALHQHLVARVISADPH